MPRPRRTPPDWPCRSGPPPSRAATATASSTPSQTVSHEWTPTRCAITASTGEALVAVCAALGEVGAEVVDVVTVLGRDDALSDLPDELTSLLRVEVVDGEVRIEK